MRLWFVCAMRSKSNRSASFQKIRFYLKTWISSFGIPNNESLVCSFKLKHKNVVCSQGCNINIYCTLRWKVETFHEYRQYGHEIKRGEKNTIFFKVFSSFPLEFIKFCLDFEYFEKPNCDFPQFCNLCAFWVHAKDESDTFAWFFSVYPNLFPITAALV